MAEATMQSSLVGKLEADIEIKTPAEKFYNVLARRPHDVPKATRDNIQGCDLREGQFGKVGSILFWNYVMDGEPKVMKERIVASEPEKNLISARVIDGDVLKEFNSFLITFQATPKQRGPGSVVKCLVEYERIDDKVAHPENLLSMFVKASKDIDELLLSEE